MSTPILPPMKRMLSMLKDEPAAKRVRDSDTITAGMQKYSTPAASHFFAKHNALLQQSCELSRHVLIEKTAAAAVPHLDDIASVNTFFAHTGDQMTQLVSNSARYQQLMRESETLLALYKRQLGVLQRSPVQDMAKHTTELLSILYAMATLRRMKVKFDVVESTCMRDILVHAYSMCKEIQKESTK